MLDTIRANVLHRERLQHHEQSRAEAEDFMRAERERFRKESAARQPQSKSVSKAEIDKARLERVAAGIYQHMFTGEREKFCEPKIGTIMHRIWKSNKLNIRHQRAWKMFMRDFNGAAGNSDKLCASYSEYIDVSGGEGHRVVAYVNDEYERVDRICNHFLGKQERILLGDLITDTIQKPGFIQLELVGLVRNGYKAVDQARAAGIANICYLMDRIGDFYGL